MTSKRVKIVAFANEPRAKLPSVKVKESIRTNKPSIVKLMNTIDNYSNMPQKYTGSQSFFPKSKLIKSVPKKTQKYTLAISAIFYQEAPYLNEWIDFHHKQGVMHFYLYDNESSIANYKLLLPYIQKNIVTYNKWLDTNATQLAAYKHCLIYYGLECRWIAFIDIDEFLYSTIKDQNLGSMLQHYHCPDISQLEITRYNFGNNGHITKPDGLVTANYIMREQKRTRVKSIVNPSNLKRGRLSKSVHKFNNLFISGYSLSHDLPFRINHYMTKSTEEFHKRNLMWITKNKGNCFNKPSDRLTNDKLPIQLNEIVDKSILDYV